jgi:hypothetical protein
VLTLGEPGKGRLPSQAIGGHDLSSKQFVLGSLAGAENCYMATAVS